MYVINTFEYFNTRYRIFQDVKFSLPFFHTKETNLLFIANVILYLLGGLKLHGVRSAE